MDINKYLGRDRWDKNRGLQKDAFMDAIQRASAETVEVSVNPPKQDLWPRTTTDDDTGDPYSNTYIKPKNTKYWEKEPSTPEEKAIYFGQHMHTESNPFGLHSHMIGGKLGGGHSHGPQNRMGTHSHRDDNPKMIEVDGKHTHEGANYPDGNHEHNWSNFG